MTARPRRLLCRALLALAIAFAQLVGVAHAATHVVKHGADHEHHKGIKTQACDDCLSFAQEQGGGQDVLTTPAATWSLLADTAPWLDFPRTAALSAFHSRAPPAPPSL